MIRKAILTIVCAVVITAVPAFASITGLTVESATSTTFAGTVDGDDNTIYYIPLDGSGDTSGTYGVTDTGGGLLAGTFSDSGFGFGYDPAGGLLMFMRFDLTSPQFNPSAATSVDFVFDDLDLVDIGDPAGFFESVQFGYFDDSGTEIDLTDTLFDFSDGFGSVLAGVDASISSLGGSDDPLTITFSGSTWTSIVNDVADAGGIYEDEFYMSLRFGSVGTGGSNTSEELISAAFTSAVPEPTTVSIWLSLIALGCVSRRRQAK